MSKNRKPKVVLPPNPYLVINEIDWTTGKDIGTHVIRFTAGVMLSRVPAGMATYTVHAPGKPTIYASSITMARTTEAALGALAQQTIAECR
jgi:hypothetical protein